ncbi:MAG: hypothetical protein WEC59_08200 [Salibacteraceae bacterium]
MMNNSTTPLEKEVLNETGKTMQQWFSELAQKKFECIHWKDQIEKLAENYDLEASWAEYIAMSYCSECGLPWKDQAYKGFEITVTKTVNQPINSVLTLTKEWFEHEQRVVQKSRLNGSKIKYEWVNDQSHIDVKLKSINKEKTKMVIKHDGLKSQVDASVMRNFWKEHMRTMVESL